MTQAPQRQPGLVRRILLFYWHGFQQMTVGRTLWKLILIKLLIIFAILKVFFFPDFLATNFDTDHERAEHVAGELTRPAQSTTF